jgi:hypothetical protein
MDTVVADVRGCLEAELLPVLEDGAAKGAGGSVLRVSGAKNLATEVYDNA